MKIEKRLISELKEWDKNPRTISKDAFDRLKYQVEKLKDYKPLLITPDNVVIGGNMRLKAYRELGIKETMVSVVDPKNENEKWEYALSDNDHVGATDSDMLANEMPNLDIEWSKYAVDIKEPTNLQELLNQFKPVEEDEAPEVGQGEAVSKLGEVYQLGRHRLMCGDSTKIEDVEKLMDGKKADMVFTDPPYGMDLDTDFSKIKGTENSPNAKGYKYDKVIGDDKPFNYQDFTWIDCKEQFWWGADYYARTLSEDGSWFVWLKRNEADSEMLGNEFEMCWSKQRHRKEIIRKRWVGFNAIENGDKRVHPTQKPIELCAWFINKFSQPEQKIVDLFGGSGSTLIACEQTNRTCFMMELDPKYVDVIRKRYAKFIGKEEEWQTITPIIK